jgi:hypothetical protein
VTAGPARSSGFGQRAPYGGHRSSVTFTAQETAVLAAVADELVPAGGGFPAPSTVGVVDFIAWYVTPRDRPVTHYPYAGEDEFKASVAELGPAFVDADRAIRVAVLQRLEVETATFFSQLRDLVYYGYYSRPAVIRAIRDHLEAGRDYHGPPQPYGYADDVEPWGDVIFPTDRRGFTATEDVRRVEPTP